MKIYWPRTLRSSLKRISPNLTNTLSITLPRSCVQIHPSTLITSLLGRLLTLLSQQKAVSLLKRNTVSRVLVIWREARWVCRLGDLAVVDLLQRVDALAGRVKGVHKMHGCGLVFN